MRGVALAGGILVVVVQTAGVEVGTNILGERFLVKTYHPLYEYRLAVLKLGAFGCGKRPAPQLGGNLELLALLETVRRAGVAQPSGFKVGLDKRGEFLTFAVHHFF